MKRNFLFIKSTTESTVIPVDSFSHAEYTSDTTVTMYFDAKRGGKDATIAVVLTVSSGKANDVISSITNQITSGKADIMRYDAASTPNKYHTSNVTGITSITTTEAPTIVGADGSDGADGADGTNGTNGTNGTDGKTGNLATLAGRFQFDADDDNRTIIIGSSSFGTNYYLWNTEVFDTIDDGTVDSTAFNLSNLYGGLSFRLPSDGKVRWDWATRPGNTNSSSQNFRAQIWSVSSFGSVQGATSWTLRADKAFTSGSSTGGWTPDNVTTTSSLNAGDYVLFVVGLDDASISSTVFLSFQSTVLQVD